MKITTELKGKWRFKTHPNIQITKELVIFNSLTNRTKKITLNNYSKGLWLDSKKFVLKSRINKLVELIPTDDYCPF